MSLLSTDRLHVSLEPESLAVCRVRGVFRKTLISKAVVECDPQYGRLPWEGALEALKQSIGALGRERLKTSVVLSNRLVRYALVPSDAAASGPQEELALARFHFTRIYGERAKTWDLRLSEGAAGSARIASAIDQGLVEGLRACFALPEGPRLVSVQPYLAAAFNGWRGSNNGKEPAWLVLHERERACFALASREGWHSVQSVRVATAGDLLPLLEREGLRAGNAVRTATIHGATPEAGPGWTLSPPRLPPLEGFSPLDDSRDTMALCAA